MKFLILSFIFLFPFISRATPVSWGLNDVTYIMPLPLNAKENNLLKLQSEGVKGVMIPEAMVMQLPFMDMEHEKAQINTMTRLMTVRIDNCFPLPTPQSCQKQIRMVWQPVLEKDGVITTVDAAFHSFYVLTDEEFTSLLQDLKSWKKKYQKRESFAATEALDIHPYWKHDKDESHALLDFNTLITKYAGEKNLTRVTVMVLRRMNDVWGFLGAEVKEGKLEVGAIPRLDGKTSQMFFNSLRDINQYVGAMMNPSPLKPEANLNTFINKATNSEVFTEQELVGNLQSAFAIENPNLFNPESMDCVNCHIAQSSREWLVAKITSTTTIDQNLFSAFKYMNASYNLENKSTQVFNTHQLRGVGYFGQNLAISQRVINESAVVAEWLSAND